MRGESTYKSQMQWYGGEKLIWNSGQGYISTHKPHPHRQHVMHTYNMSCTLKHDTHSYMYTVGGRESGRDAAVNHVYTYVQETQEWEKSIPPRALPTVITYNSGIPVCGGLGRDRMVEVFNSETAQWYTAAPLPVACKYMQLTIINDTCYLGGGGILSPSCMPHCPVSSSPAHHMSNKYLLNSSQYGPCFLTCPSMIVH